MKPTKVKLLDEIEHVLKVPTRYIGSTNPTQVHGWIIDGDKFTKTDYEIVPAFITLFREILSNSIDEYVRTNGQFSNKIDVTFDGEYFEVKDNGRGISHTEEEKTKLPEAVIAFTRLKAGTNFEDDQSETIGMHGEGAALTNIFSEIFTVETSDGVKKTTLECKNNLSEYSFKQTKNKTQFTNVKWKPDYEKLNMVDFSLEKYQDIFRKIVMEMSLCYTNIKFTYNNEKISAIKFKDYINRYDTNYESFSYQNLDIALIPSHEFEQVSFINGIYTRLGGIHVDTITSTLSNTIRDLFQKKYPEMKPLDVKNKLFFIINIKNFKKPKFSNQLKEELTNTDFESELFSDVDFNKIASKVKANNSIIEYVVESFKIKEELKKRKGLEKDEKKLQKINIDKLIESYEIDREKCRLYLAEGKSALMHFLTCRESNHAAYPLKGKFVNCSKKSRVELMKNEEVKDILATTGLKLTSNDISNMRYGKIVIFSDADYDGDAICALLMNFFYRYWPELFKQGKIYRAVTPLIVAVNNQKEKKYFFSISAYEEACKTEEWKIKSFNKGLGSLSEEEYKFSLDNLVKITDDDISEQSLEIVFGKDSDIRKEWMV